MDNITEDEVVTILRECLDNGRAGPQALWLWFLTEGYLIEQALEDIAIDNGASMI